MNLAELHIGQNGTLARDTWPGRFDWNDTLAGDTLARDAWTRVTLWPVFLTKVPNS